MNNVILKGRWTKDVEIKETADKKPVANGVLAVDRDGKDAGADFLPIVAFGKTAEFLSKYANKKGAAVLISGGLRSNSYEKDGQKRTSYSVVAQRVEFCESRNPAAAAAPAPADPEPEEEEEEIPFR